MKINKFYSAKNVLKTVIRETYCIPATNICSKNHLFLKTENLQITGSFKIRGAYYKISQLSEAQKNCGIVASSAGNHAQGVALAAKKFDIPCIICMPDSAPISKVEATKSYGAKVILVEGGYDEAYTFAQNLCDEKKMTFIHPFDDKDVIAGQGTIALEILDQVENLDAIVVPIGGGGLISGIAFAAKSLKPEIKIYGVQATKAASMFNSIKNEKIFPIETAETFADGIAVKKPGAITFNIIQEYVDQIVTVSEDEIAAAILTIMEKQKLVVEGAGAVSVAACMFDKIPLQDKNVCCILSGGNIDINIIDRVMARGLLISGRKTSFTLALIDKPGQLLKVSKILTDNGANVVAIDHDKGDQDMAITSCFLKVTLETKNHDHLMQIKKEFIKNGFEIVKERI